MNEEDSMRKLLATITVIGAVIPAVAFATPPAAAPTGGATPVVKKVEHKSKCKSKACEKRVALKKQKRIRAFCASTACKRRVARKAARNRVPALSPLARCIISRESGGNPKAVNGQYHGIAQWGPPAWAKMGGLKYASDPLNATYAQQVRVLMYGLAHFGSGDWSPYDGC